MKVKIKDLEQLVDRLNTVTGNNLKPRSEGKSNIGTYCLDGAYGGWKLAQITNESGGENEPLGGGFKTKKELYEMIKCYLLGLTIK